MSTKIWTAYKLRRASYLWPLVHDIRLRATKNVRKTLREFYSTHIPEVKTDTDLYRKAFEVYGNEYKARLDVARRMLQRLYRWSTTRSERSPYNFDVSVGFRQYEGKIVVIPYCDWTMRGVLDFLAKDKRLRDYHYQNQVDRPKTVGARQWDERRRFYNSMDSAGQWEDVLALDICRFDMWWRVDPWMDLARNEKAWPQGKDSNPQSTR